MKTNDDNDENDENTKKPVSFTAASVRRFKPPKVGQTVHWDGGTNGQRGLSVLVSAGGTRTFRATYYWPNKKGKLNGKGKVILVPISVSLGRVGEMDLGRARERTAEYRKKAMAGINPQSVKTAEQVASRGVPSFLVRMRPSAHHFSSCSTS